MVFIHVTGVRVSVGSPLKPNNFIIFFSLILAKKYKITTLFFKEI